MCRCPVRQGREDGSLFLWAPGTSCPKTAQPNPRSLSSTAFFLPCNDLVFYRLWLWGSLPFTGDISIGCVLDVWVLVLVNRSEGGQVRVNLQKNIKFFIGFTILPDFTTLVNIGVCSILQPQLCLWDILLWDILLWDILLQLYTSTHSLHKPLTKSICNTLSKKYVNKYF